MRLSSEVWLMKFPDNHRWFKESSIFIYQGSLGATKAWGMVRRLGVTIPKHWHTQPGDNKSVKWGYPYLHAFNTLFPWDTVVSQSAFSLLIWEITYLFTPKPLPKLMPINNLSDMKSCAKFLKPNLYPIIVCVKWNHKPNKKNDNSCHPFAMMRLLWCPTILNKLQQQTVGSGTFIGTQCGLMMPYGDI